MAADQQSEHEPRDPAEADLTAASDGTAAIDDTAAGDGTAAGDETAAGDISAADAALAAPAEDGSDTGDLIAPVVDDEPAAADASQVEQDAVTEREEQLTRLFTATVMGPADERIGKVGQVYLDDQTQEPNWITVKTGLFGSKEYFIPLDEAQLDGKHIVVPYTKADVTAAPTTEIDQNLSPDEEDALYNHYRVPGRMTGDEAEAAAATLEPDTEDPFVVREVEPDTEEPFVVREGRSDDGDAPDAAEATGATEATETGTPAREFDESGWSAPLAHHLDTRAAPAPVRDDPPATSDESHADAGEASLGELLEEADRRDADDDGEPDDFAAFRRPDR